jgi:hypothetical protein
MLARLWQASCCRVKYSHSGYGRKSVHLASEAGPSSCGLWSSAPGVVFRESWNDKPATLVDGFMTLPNPYHPRRKSPARLTKPVIPDYGFALPAVYWAAAQREGDDNRIGDLLPDDHRAGASRSRLRVRRSHAPRRAPTTARRVIRPSDPRS